MATNNKTYPTLSIEAIAFQLSSGRAYEGHIKGCSESVIIEVHEDYLMQSSIASSPLPQDTVMAIFTPHAKMPNYPQCLASFNMENISNATNVAALRQQINLLQNINTGVGYAAEATKFALRNYGNYSFALHRTGARLYPNGWGGNGKIKVYKISLATNKGWQKMAGKIGEGTFFIGAGFDAWLASNKEQSWEKFGMNTGMSAIGTWGAKIGLGPWGWIAALLYAVVDITGVFDIPLDTRLSDEEYDKMKQPPKSISESTSHPKGEQVKLHNEMKYPEPPKNTIKENLLPPKK